MRCLGYFHVMNYEIRNVPLLKKILWADSLLGSSTAIAGLLLYPLLDDFLGLSEKFIVVISAVTSLYGLWALSLVLRSSPPAGPLRVLVYANWIWTAISMVLLFLHIANTTPFGAAFLVLQVVVVGLLAYLEGRHIYRSKQG